MMKVSRSNGIIGAREHKVEGELILETVGITKVYPGTVALDDVNFKVYKGCVNAFVGENGAGKSTLMKILAGVEKPTKGSILINGKEIQFSSPDNASDHGIGMIFQELNLFHNMNVRDNIFSGREILNSFGTIDYQAEDQIAEEVLSKMEESINLHTLVDYLRVGQQQIVEIAKALSQNAKILIMDEPTSALSISEVNILFSVIRDLIENGVTIIYITHKLGELFEIADYVTILRDGRLVAEAKIPEVDISWIIEKMLGQKAEQYYSQTDQKPGDLLLEVDSISLMHPYITSRLILDSISFKLFQGEILGFYGLIGSGRTEILDCLIGRQPIADGEILFEGKNIIKKSIKERMNLGLALIPEDRQKDGLVPLMSVLENMTLANLKDFIIRLFLSYKKEQKYVKQLIKKLSIKVSNLKQIISTLSGGNQQKVIIARALLTSPKVLLMDEPTRGIDVGAKTEIYKTINRLAKEGYGIIFVSSELDEVMAISNRIIVVSKGKMTGLFNKNDATKEKLIMAASSGSRNGEDN